MGPWQQAWVAVDDLTEFALPPGLGQRRVEAATALIRGIDAVETHPNREMTTGTVVSLAGALAVLHHWQVSANLGAIQLDPV
ncbi:hypothetical protein EF096_06050 [Pseudomonas neustonica]|uniref:Uncharacterized protein n=1 Tax=Pseudomonas neustonica TaxID=2487346 RepID=A0ABX9XJJ2_9PSED|nr:hypothetical protein EF099_06460 [Pseudomonas sp. SSM44]ROZ86305.1 hypothetical protein EF096_06050 [Pseudomonas neustonica]|tara:strand:+ start:888 stop:1133 length:246 start_codon:yes stop_codon:yes gene_type:complete